MVDGCEYSDEEIKSIDHADTLLSVCQPTFPAAKYVNKCSVAPNMIARDTYALVSGNMIQDLLMRYTRSLCQGFVATTGISKTYMSS